MRRVQPGLQYSQSRSRTWSGSRLVNCFAEMAEGDKASEFAVMVMPGLVQFATVNQSPVRGIHNMQGVVYAVIGSQLFSLDSAGTATLIGTIGGSDPVQMADNGAEIAIQGGVNNDTGYVYSGGVLYTGILNLPQVSGVTYIDGYFVWPIFESDQFIISGINDGLSYDPLDIATVEGDPDNIVGVLNLQRELMFFGADTVEIWWNSGAADFPFERQGNAFIERGCKDRNSIAKIDNSAHFVGDDLIVYRLNGYLPTRISTHAIEDRIANAAYFRSLVYSQLGHKFYILNTDLGTFCYDMATGAWHERKALDRDRWGISCSTECYDQTIFGGFFGGVFYTPSVDEYTQDGDPIIMEILIPSIQTDRLKSTLYAYELQCDVGVGNPDDPNPEVILTYSRDGGHTFSAELARPLGAVGEYLTRCIWRLGVSFRQLQIKLRMSSITNRLVIAHYVDVR